MRTMKREASAGSRKSKSAYSSEFVAAVWCFLLAALAGVAMRLVGAGFPLPEHVDFSNLRRAHSHLMLFGWVTPALFVLIATHARPSRAVSATVWGLLVLGLLSFPSFLLWGYGSAEIGSARVPISVIVSTLSMFGWYAFVYLYAKMRGALVKQCGEGAVRFWDGSMFLLVLGSAGAWTRGAFIGMKIEDPFLTSGVIEFFLSCFTDGFLLLGVIGLLLARTRSTSATRPTDEIVTGQVLTRRGARRAALVLMLAIPLEFLALLQVDLVPASLRIVGVVGVVVSGLVTAYIGIVLLRRSRSTGSIASGAGALLALLGGSKLLLASPAITDWVLAAGLRIPYLHVLLVGLVTFVLVTKAVQKWPRAVRPGPIGLAIAAMLLGLWATTALWPTWLPREPGLLVTAFTSVALIVVVIWMIGPSVGAKNPEHPVFTAGALEPVHPPLSVEDAQQG